MGFHILVFSFVLFTSGIYSLQPLSIEPPQFDAIYQFGDSLSDTGNFIREGSVGNNSPFGRLPYGQTLNHPTGRCSDGLLIIDFLATFFSLPLLKPFLEKGSDFTHGVNFAVAGCTALDSSTLAANNISSPAMNCSLSMQLDWFRHHLDSICKSTTECKQKLQNALFVLGEIGGNDYNYAFYQGKSIDEVSKLVPKVVNTIKNAIQHVIDAGARHIIVPGNWPIGCVPVYLAGFKTNDSTMYDEDKCLKDLNDFSKLHNNQLRQALQELQQKNAIIAIVYADWYSALGWVVHNAPLLGFEKDGVQKACCGANSNEYNFNWAQGCGSPRAVVCSDPSKRVSWDGIHLTQQAYQYMTEWLLPRIVPALATQSHVSAS